MKIKRVGAILLAAGKSSRFGENKLLYEIHGKPMVQYCLDAVRLVSFDGVRMITGYPQVEKLAAEAGVECVKNNFPEKGISHSIHLGIASLEEMDAWMFLVCDQPGLRAGTLERLLETYREGDRGIVAVACKGQIGNPVIFSQRYKDVLLSLKGDQGGKKILLGNMEDVCLVEAEAEELKDMDEKP